MEFPQIILLQNNLLGNSYGELASQGQSLEYRDSSQVVAGPSVAIVETSAKGM